MKRIISILLLVAVMMISGCGALESDPVKSTANDFMKYFREEDYYNMGQLSSIDTLIEDYVGINIIDYSIKSTSSERKVKHFINVHNYDSDMFESGKEMYTDMYPDYSVVVDSSTDWKIESPEAILSQYTVIMDVQYSDASGETKRNSVSLDITQKQPNSEQYIVSDIIGIYNPYSIS